MKRWWAISRDLLVDNKRSILLISMLSFVFITCKNKVEHPSTDIEKMSRNSLWLEDSIRRETRRNEDFELFNSRFWKDACKNPALSFLFDCSNAPQEYYQVQVHKPFTKVFYIVNVAFKDSLIHDIRITQLEYGNRSIEPLEGKNYTGKQWISILNIFCYFKSYKKISHLHGVPMLDNFFSRVIWTLPKYEHKNWLDGENYLVKGRKDGNENYWDSSLLQDALFCKNIKLLLDFCDLKGYSVNKR